MCHGQLSELLIPKMDWSSPDVPQAFKKFRKVSKRYFKGPLKDESEPENWSGDKGIELMSTWSLSSEKKKKLSTYW